MDNRKGGLAEFFSRPKAERQEVMERVLRKATEAQQKVLEEAEARYGYEGEQEQFVELPPEGITPCTIGETPLHS